MKKNGKTGAAKSEAEKKIERSRLEAKKKAKGSKASKWYWKNTTRHTAQHTWWGKTWPQNPEPLPVSDWCLAPGSWIPSGECWGEDYLPAPWEYFWPTYNQIMNPNCDNQYMKPQEDYSQGMNPQEAKELGFGEVLDKSWCLQHCPKAADPKRMPVQKSTPPLPQPLPPTP